MRGHLVDRHHMYQPSSYEVQAHRVRNHNHNDGHGRSPPSRNISFNTEEFTSVLSSMTDMIGRQVQSGIGNIFQASYSMATLMGNSSHSRSSYPKGEDSTRHNAPDAISNHDPRRSLPSIPKRKRIARSIIEVSDSDDENMPKMPKPLLSIKSKGPQTTE